MWPNKTICKSEVQQYYQDDSTPQCMIHNFQPDGGKDLLRPGAMAIWEAEAEETLAWLRAGEWERSEPGPQVTWHFEPSANINESPHEKSIPWHLNLSNKFWYLSAAASFVS